MLKRINCNIFRTKYIDFHENLNVVLGDNKATNSIGKSTLLMIIDFILGGSSYLSHNKDVVEELNHHEFKFHFIFNSHSYFFIRSTKDAKEIYKCDRNYNILTKISLEEYTTFLKEQYGLSDALLSFREIVGLFSRIWGKPNSYVKKPLQSFDKEKDKDAIIKLLKLFEKYYTIKELTEKIKKEKELKATLSKAVSNNLIPKVTKAEYKKNGIIIKNVEEELEDIKNNLIKYAINTSELVNKELIALKIEKDDLLKIKFRLENKKNRILSNLNQKNPIKSKQLKQLTEFFPSSNVEKLSTIEAFHSKLSKILKQEFKNEKEHVQERLNIVQSEINEVDIKINTLLGDSGNPITVVNRIYELTHQIKDLKQKESTFERKSTYETNISMWNNELEVKAKAITDEISEAINKELIALNDKVHDEPRTPPILLLSKDLYSFDLPKNTGTGKAFVDLILFDLAIYKLTFLPILIHDSFLFKNIENSSISNLARIYKSFNKQTFIAIDEIEKYDKEAQQIFNNSKCLELNNRKLLFIKDWREKK
jgi:hypothetical protein